MKNSVIGKVGALLLITGTAFALPAYAANHTGPGAMGMSEKGESGAKQMSGMINDMSSEMKDMSGMIESGGMSPDTMKKMSTQMKQMSGMMKDMSGMMSKDMAMDGGKQKKMDQMRKQMDQMRKDMPASPMQK